MAAQNTSNASATAASIVADAVTPIRSGSTITQPQIPQSIGEVDSAGLTQAEYFGHNRLAFVHAVEQRPVDVGRDIGHHAQNLERQALLSAMRLFRDNATAMDAIAEYQRSTMRLKRSLLNDTVLHSLVECHITSVNLESGQSRELITVAPVFSKTILLAMVADNDGSATACNFLGRGLSSAAYIARGFRGNLRSQHQIFNANQSHQPKPTHPE